jgi:hypothetical protein
MTIKKEIVISKSKVEHLPPMTAPAAIRNRITPPPPCRPADKQAAAQRDYLWNNPNCWGKPIFLARQ